MYANSENPENSDNSKNPENPENSKDSAIPQIALMLPLIADSSVMLIHANKIAKNNGKIRLWVLSPPPQHLTPSSWGEPSIAAAF